MNKATTYYLTHLVMETIVLMNKVTTYYLTHLVMETINLVPFVVS